MVFSGNLPRMPRMPRLLALSRTFGADLRTMSLSQSDGCAMSKKASLVEWNYTTASCFFIYFTHIASQETLLMTILGLQSFGRLCAERRFNSTHGWAPAFEKSHSDFHENIWESAEVTYFTYKRTA